MRVVSLLAALALSGCTGVDRGVDLTPQQIDELPYASAYSQWQGLPNALVVLAYAEPAYFSYPASQALKWVSQDGGMIVTQAGRVTKTVSVAGADLTRLVASTPDPLALGLHLASTPKTWQYQVDWGRGAYDGVTVDATYAKGELVDGEQQWVETTHYATGQTIVNHYWLNPNTGKVLRSQQQPVPHLPVLNFKIIKSFKGA